MAAGVLVVLRPWWCKGDQAGEGREERVRGEGLGRLVDG